MALLTLFFFKASLWLYTTTTTTTTTRVLFRLSACLPPMEVTSVDGLKPILQIYRGWRADRVWWCREEDPHPPAHLAPSASVCPRILQRRRRRALEEHVAGQQRGIRLNRALPKVVGRRRPRRLSRFIAACGVVVVVVVVFIWWGRTQNRSQKMN